MVAFGAPKPPSNRLQTAYSICRQQTSKAAKTEDNRSQTANTTGLQDYKPTFAAMAPGGPADIYTQARKSLNMRKTVAENNRAFFL